MQAQEEMLKQEIKTLQTKVSRHADELSAAYRSGFYDGSKAQREQMSGWLKALPSPVPDKPI